MADGWAVLVKMGVIGGGESTQLFYAHLPNRMDAENAVKKHISASPDVRIEAQKSVPHNAFVEMHIPEGGVGQ